MTPAERAALAADNVGWARARVLGALKRIPARVDREDLVAAGALGLVDAARRWDPESGVEFRAFAQRRVVGAALDELRRNDWAPRSLRRAGRRLAEAEASGADGAGVDRLKADLYAAVVGALVAVRANGGEEEDVDPPDPGPGALDRLLAEEAERKVRDAVAALDPPQRVVVELVHWADVALVDAADLLGVVESRASQLHSAALAALRRALDPRGADRVEDEDVLAEVERWLK